ncbi:Tn3 family transposase [Streptomyces bohaiensis]
MIAGFDDHLTGEVTRFARSVELWGQGSIAFASDSTHVRAFGQNLFTEWHSRYGGRKVLVHWHVEKESPAIHSPLINCTASTSPRRPFPTLGPRRAAPCAPPWREHEPAQAQHVASRAASGVTRDRHMAEPGGSPSRATVPTARPLPSQAPPTERRRTLW